MGHDTVQRLDDVFESVGVLVERPVLDAEEGAGEVVQRLPAIGALADQGVGVEPDQLALDIVVLVALPGAPACGATLADDRVVDRVLHRAPFAADGVVIGRGVERQGVQRLLAAVQTRAGGQNLAPELGLALIDPQQLVLERQVVVGDVLTGRAAIFAVPGVGVFVAQQVAVAELGLPVGEEPGIDAVLGRAVMLQPDAAQPVGHGEQEIVVVVVARAVQAVGLIDQIAQDFDLGFGRGNVAVGAVGDDVQADRRTAAGIEVDLAIVFAREHGAVDQDVERDGLEGGDGAGGGLRAPGSAVLPALGQGDTGLHGDVPVEATGGVEQHLLPLDVQHLGSHGDPALVTRGWRQVLEVGDQFSGTGRDDDVEGPGLKRVADPFDALAVCREDQAAQLRDRAGRAVVARKPLREEQGERDRRPRPGWSRAPGRCGGSGRWRRRPAGRRRARR